MLNIAAKTTPQGEFAARVYCPICTHTVNAQAVNLGKRHKVKPGQRCARCASSLDAGVVITMATAA
jgi:uncharacterized Zn finger protein (UPF0148 family)